jgi:hypothetical protein
MRPDHSDVGGSSIVSEATAISFVSPSTIRAAEQEITEP